MIERGQQDQGLCTVVGPGSRRDAVMRSFEKWWWFKLNFSQCRDVVWLMKFVRYTKRIANQETDQPACDVVFQAHQLAFLKRLLPKRHALECGASSPLC